MSAGSTDDSAERAKNIILALSIDAIIAAIGFAIWVTLSITAPIGKAVDAAMRLADGGLTVKLDSDSKDEVGMLMSAL